jgi:hypothetical protein
MIATAAHFNGQGMELRIATWGALIVSRRRNNFQRMS